VQGDQQPAEAALGPRQTARKRKAAECSDPSQEAAPQANRSAQQASGAAAAGPTVRDQHDAADNRSKCTACAAATAHGAEATQLPSQLPSRPLGGGKREDPPSRLRGEASRGADAAPTALRNQPAAARDRTVLASEGIAAGEAPTEAASQRGKETSRANQPALLHLFVPVSASGAGVSTPCLAVARHRTGAQQQRNLIRKSGLMAATAVTTLPRSLTVVEAVPSHRACTWHTWRQCRIAAAV